MLDYIFRYQLMYATDLAKYSRLFYLQLEIVSYRKFVKVPIK